jgi:hypothetical protein
MRYPKNLTTETTTFEIDITLAIPPLREAATRQDTDHSHTLWEQNAN